MSPFYLKMSNFLTVQNIKIKLTYAFYIWNPDCDTCSLGHVHWQKVFQISYFDYFLGLCDQYPAPTLVET